MTPISIRGPIGANAGGVSALEICRQIQAAPGGVSIRVTSEGGDGAEGLAIARAIRMERGRGRRVETVVEGLAASAATLITCAGEPRRIASDALFMIHMPALVPLPSAASPNFEERRESRRKLAGLVEDMLDLYRDATGLSRERIRSMMKAETWMDASLAVEFGFATAAIAAVPIAARLSSPLLARLTPPAQFRQRFDRIVSPHVVTWRRAFINARIGGVL